MMKFSIAWAGLLITFPVLADTVVPADKVENHVNIRQAPENGAEVVGRLQQGESLPFVASTEGWNEVQLASGETGYISADWSKVVAETAAEEPTEPEVEPPVAELELEPEPEPPVGTENEQEPETVEADEPATEVEAVVDVVPEPEAEAEIDAEPAQEPEPVSADAPVAGLPGPPGPPGPAGPAGPPGVDGEGAMKGKPDYLVKFKTETTGNASQVFDNGNHVGIGTDEPTQRLDVNGSIQIHDRNSNLAGLMITQADGETGYVMHNRASTLTIGAGSIDRITIDREGNVGFGTARPAHPIEMASGAHVTAGGVWTNSSSRANKENIHALSADEAMATLRELEPVHFNYRSDSAEQHVGFIAEDVPDIVATSDRKGLSTMDIVAVLTRVIQAQQQQIEDLEARLDSAR